MRPPRRMPRASPEEAPLGGGLILVYQSHETIGTLRSFGGPAARSISSAWMPAPGCKHSSGHGRGLFCAGISGSSGHLIESTSS